MAGRYSIVRIEDIPATSTVANLLEGLPGAFPKEPSGVKVYATRESVDVSMGVTIERDVALPTGSPANIVAAVGTLPSRQDDLIVEAGAGAGEQIIIQGVNTNVAAQELRILVEITPVDDLGIFSQT